MSQSVGYKTLSLRALLPNVGIPLRRILQKSVQSASKPDAGTLLLEETGDFSPRTLLSDLTQSGYVLINTRCEAWMSRKRSLYAVLFVFAHRDNDASIVSPWFSQMREDLEHELDRALQNAIWQRVRIFSNPIFDAGVEIPGIRSATIVLDQRQSLHQPNGEPVMIFPTEDDLPIPITPAHLIRFTNSTLYFESI